MSMSAENNGAPIAPPPSPSTNENEPRRSGRVYLPWTAFSPFLPLPLDEGSFLNLVSMGGAPQASRSWKGKRLWSATILVQWCYLKYGQQLPDECDLFEREIA